MTECKLRFAVCMIGPEIVRIATFLLFLVDGLLHAVLRKSVYKGYSSKA